MKKISINGIIGLDVRSSDFIKQMEESQGEEKTIEIHSPGGSVMEGLAIYNTIHQSKDNIKIRVLGLAASMGSIIAMAKGKPEVAKRSIFMIHNAQMFAMGDHQVLQKAADLSKRVSDMLASIYAEKTKKSKKSICEMMDKETYLFGQQIKDEGFASSVYDDGKEEKEEDAYAMAQLEMEECTKKMQGYKEDFAMAAQLIDCIQPSVQTSAAFIGLNGTPVDGRVGGYQDDKIQNNYHGFTPASNAGNNKITEVKSMTLNELLAQNPAAKIEYDNALNLQFEAGIKKGKDDMLAVSAHAAKFANNENYPKAVSKLAVEVMEGKKTIDALDALVANADMFKEMQNSTNAKNEQPKETPAQQIPTGANAEFNKIVAEDKALCGMEVK